LLKANLYPVYKYTSNFYGHDFLWCIIHNFGEKTGMFGNLSSIIEAPRLAKMASPSGFSGIGLAMEGVHNNPIVYELSTEMASSKAPTVEGLKPWLRRYVDSRYNGSSTGDTSYDAWDLMTESSVGGIYTTWEDISGEGIINGNPDFRTAPINGSRLPSVTPPNHNATNEVTSLRLLFDAVSSYMSTPSLLGYDLVDMTRQFLDNLLWDLSRHVESSFHDKEPWAHNITSLLVDAWLKQASDLDRVLNSHPSFMLGPWLGSARASATSEAEKRLLEFNARNQLTLWGPGNGGPSIDDYARKQWGGLVMSYYVNGRYGISLKEMVSASVEKRPFDAPKVASERAAFEQAWQMNHTEQFPTVAQGQVAEIVSEILSRYAPEEREVREKYGVLENHDAVSSVSLLPQPAWSKDVGTLSYLCNTHPSCAGFTTRGVLVTGAVLVPGGIQPEPGVQLYLKAGH